MQQSAFRTSVSARLDKLLNLSVPPLIKSSAAVSPALGPLGRVIGLSTAGQTIKQNVACTSPISGRNWTSRFSRGTLEQLQFHPSRHCLTLIRARILRWNRLCNATLVLLLVSQLLQNVQVCKSWSLQSKPAWGSYHVENGYWCPGREWWRNNSQNSMPATGKVN